mgnify:CR=1 FL=1
MSVQITPTGRNDDLNGDTSSGLQKLVSKSNFIEPKKKRTVMDELLVQDHGHHHGERDKWILRKFDDLLCHLIGSFFRVSLLLL